MARGTPLTRIVEMVRNEARISTNPSRGIDNRDYIVTLIRRHYETLCDKYDWSFLHVRNEDALKALQKGERYYDFPVKMDQRYTIAAWVFWGNVYLPLSYGIGPREYSAFDSDNPAVMIDPVLKWQIRDDTQFEVWPPPASNGSLAVRPFTSPVVRFEGKRIPNALIDDLDTCDMDDQLVALYAAAEVLEQQEKGSGSIKLAAAVDRLNTLKGMYTHHSRVRMGSGGMNPNDGMSPGWPRIRVFPASN
jgi:hypothetical protein